jgi:hypothetical protein
MTDWTHKITAAPARRMSRRATPLMGLAVVGGASLAIWGALIAAVVHVL